MSRINIGSVCVFSASTLSIIFALLEMLSQYQGAGNIRGAFRTLSNRMDFFGRIGNGVYLHQVSAFSTDHDTMTFTSQNSLQNHFFVKSYNRKRYELQGRYELWVHIVSCFNKKFTFFQISIMANEKKNSWNAK